MKVDPRHLAQLSMIVETGSFESAARRLAMTQPALSRNMRLLETRVGASVFDRSGRRAVATEIGRRLARQGLNIRMAEEQASAYASLAQSGEAGLLRIGAGPAVAGPFLSKALGALLIANSDINVELHVSTVPDLRVMLERGQIDVIIGPVGLAHQVEGLIVEPFVEDRIGILCRRGHRLARAGVGPEELQSQSWIAPLRGSSLRYQTENALSALGLREYRVVMESNSTVSILDVVASTDALTALPRLPMAAMDDARHVFLDVDHPQFARPIGVITRRLAAPMPLKDALLRSLRQAVDAIQIPAAGALPTRRRKKAGA